MSITRDNEREPGGAAEVAPRPDAPWLAREEWARGEVRHTAASSLKTAWLFAILWNALSSPALIMGIPEMMKKNRVSDAALMSLFPLFGFFILLWALRLTIQWYRFGTSILRLETLPGVIGGPFRGRLIAPAGLRGFDEIEVTLSCTHRKISRTRNGTSKTDRILWRDERVVPAGEVLSGPVSTEVSFEFTIPYDCEESDYANESSFRFWSVHASADVPGVDYAAVFEVPVFRTAESDPAVTGAVAEVELARALEPGRHDFKGIRVSTTPSGGLDVFIPPFRHLGLAFGSLCFVLGFLGVALFSYAKGAPLIFPLVFGGFGLLLVPLVVHWLLVQTWLVVEDGHVRLKRSWLGMGWVKTFPLDVVRDIHLGVGAHATSDFYRPDVSYTIEFELEGGTRLSMGEVLPNRRLTERLAGHIKSLIP